MPQQGRQSISAIIVNGPCGWMPPHALAPWLSDEASVGRIAWMSRVTGLDLIELGTVAGQDQLAEPSVSLPLATALSILTGAQLLAGIDPERVVLAGHGVGEIAAAALSGVLSEEAALVLSARVGHAQTGAAAKPERSGLVALLGGYPPDVEERLAELGLTIAAYNGAGTIVAAGPRSALSCLLHRPPSHARAEPLPARSAFYSPSMSSTAAEWRAALLGVTIGEPRYTLLSGWDGRPTAGGRQFLHGAACQLTGPVHWDLVFEELGRQSVMRAVEVAPAGVLAGYAARAVPGLSVLPLRTPEGLLHARTMLGCADLVCEG